MESPESIFSDGDGTADATLAQALIRHASGRATLAEVVEALTCARVLIPVVGSIMVALEMPDGRRALPVFTDVDALTAWKPEARPVAAEGPRAALAAVSEGWQVMVLNPGLESVLVPRPALWALAQGNPWRPAVTAGKVDDEVVEAVLTIVTAEPGVLDAVVTEGSEAEVAVTLYLTAGSEGEASAVIDRVRAGVARSPVIAQRVNGLEIVVDRLSRS
jgi:hypothetical protein